jgi:surfactin synthase thioesterase subunit
MKRMRKPVVEQLETKLLPTPVFVFNGNGFAEATPNQLTQNAADILAAHGDRAVQLATPAMNGPAAFYQLANEIRSISKGQPIGLMGFSAGGTLALRLASLPGLNVRAAVSYYGPPDLSAWLSYHKGDRFYAKVTSDTHFNKGIIKLLSGVSGSNARLIDAFGLRDHNVVSSFSSAVFRRDFPLGQVYFYPGPHGVGAKAQPAALADFLTHL